MSRTLKRKVKGNKDLAVSNLRNEKETSIWHPGLVNLKGKDKEVEDERTKHKIEEKHVNQESIIKVSNSKGRGVTLRRR